MTESTQCQETVFWAFFWAILYFYLIISDTETGVQNDTLDAPLILYDRKWTCTGIEGINRTCFDGVAEPGVEITDNYPVPIGSYLFQLNSPSVSSRNF